MSVEDGHFYDDPDNTGFCCVCNEEAEKHWLVARVIEQQVRILGRSLVIHNRRWMAWFFGDRSVYPDAFDGEHSARTAIEQATAEIEAEVAAEIQNEEVDAGKATGSDGQAVAPDRGGAQSEAD